MAGTWSLRWDALPPTLVITCTSSDFRNQTPDRPEYEYLRKAIEVQLVELNDDSLTFASPNPVLKWRGHRPAKE
jgi:hypothetical protein